MTDPTDPADDLIALANKVSECATALAHTTSERADPARAAAIIDALADAPKGTRNCDMMLALAIAIAIQAKFTSEETGVSLTTAISIIATALGLLARRANVIEMPSDPKHIH